MLYKYETDFAELIESEFNGKFESSTTSHWQQKALTRKKAVDKFLWNEKQGLYFDYNVVRNNFV